MARRRPCSRDAHLNLILHYPSSPTGDTWKTDELKALAKIGSR